MEPLLRRAASSSCGACTYALQRQVASRRVATQWQRALTTTSRDVRRATRSADKKSHARSFTSNSDRKAEALAFNSNATPGTGAQTPNPKLSEDNLFHPFSTSPVPEFRRRAAFMRQHAHCPHPDHKATKLPTVAPKAEETASVRRRGQRRRATRLLSSILSQ